jgi:signal peptidase II
MRLTKLPRALAVAIIMLACVGCDQATKLVAKEHLRPGEIISFAGDTFRLQYAENTGAFLGLGSSLPERWRHLIFTVLVGFFLLGLMFYVLLSRELLIAQVLYLTLVLSGGTSNLLDRIVYDGRVIDFLNVGIGPIRTGIFNVADMAITAGALLLAVECFRKTPQRSAGS